MHGFINVQQVASRYGVRPETVRRWLRSGKLVGFRPGGGGDWRVSTEALAAFEALVTPAYRATEVGTGTPRI